SAKKAPASRSTSPSTGRTARASATGAARSEPEADPASALGKATRRKPLSGKKAPAVEPLAGHVEEHGGAWTMRVRLDGKRHRLRLGALSEMSKARAEEKGAAWRERMAREGRGVAPSTPTVTTVRAHFEAWISGEMFRQYGAVNGLKIKASANTDRQRA